MFALSYSNLGRICETSDRISLSKFIRDRYLFLITAMAESAASHKYFLAKRLNIRSDLFAKAGHSSFNEI